MSLWLYIVLFLILLIVVVALFSSIFFHLVLEDKRRRGSLKWLCANFSWDWSTKKSGFDLLNRRIWTGSLEKKEKPRKKKKKKRPNYLVLWQEKEIMLKTAKIAFSSIVDLLRRSRLEKLLLDAKIATPDPALTGALYGGISSISYPLRSFLPRSSINVYPDFETDSFKGKAEISLKTGLLDIFCVIVGAFFRLPKMAIIRLIRKLKKSRR
jgi:hypothetical protein